MSDTTVLVDGLYFGEGPRWHDGRLWFERAEGASGGATAGSRFHFTLPAA